jgi:hypothetical protein
VAHQLHEARGCIEEVRLDRRLRSVRGEELDGEADWALMKDLFWAFGGGMLFPDAASGDLLSDTDPFIHDAWALRTTLVFNFATPAKG